MEVAGLVPADSKSNMWTLSLAAYSNSAFSSSNAVDDVDNGEDNGIVSESDCSNLFSSSSSSSNCCFLLRWLGGGSGGGGGCCCCCCCCD